MAKGKKRPARQRWALRAVEGVQERAERLLDGKDPGEAARTLRPRAERAPKDVALQLAAAQALHGVGQEDDAVELLERAAALSPSDRLLQRALALAYGLAGLPVHAARAAQALDPDADQGMLQAIHADADAMVSDIAAKMGLTREEAEEAGYQYHEGLFAMRRHRLDEALAATDRALALAPNLVPALNNRAELLSNRARLDEAITILHRVVYDLEPENTFALAGLVRMEQYAGHPREAEAAAERLRRIQPADRKQVTDIARGLSWVDDDQGVYRCLHGMDGLDPMYRHFLAVAASNLGKREEARREWQALAKAPDCRRLAENALGKLQAGGRGRMYYHSPTAMILSDDIGRLEELGKKARGGDEGARKEREELLRAHPEWVLAGEVALRDPEFLKLGLGLLEMLGTPAAAEALRRFATGKEGPEESRMEAGYALVRLGVLKPSDSLPFWRKGEFRATSFKRFDVVDEPVVLPPEAVEAARRPLELMGEGRYQEALPLLQALVAQFPEIPDFRNDLGATYAGLERCDEAIEARRQALRIDPESVRARLALAHFALDEGDVEYVTETLKSLADVTRFRTNEYVSYMLLQARMALREDEFEQARMLVQNARTVAPDHPALDEIDSRINLREGLGSFETSFGAFMERYREKARSAHARRRAAVTTRDPSLDEALLPLPKHDLVAITHHVGLSGVSAYRKDEMRRAIVEHLRMDWPLDHIVAGLQPDEREALSWLLDSGGSVPLDAFAQRYPVELPRRPNYPNPEVLLDRLLAKGLSVEAAPGGEPVVTIPVDLREPLRRRLARAGDLQ